MSPGARLLAAMVILALVGVVEHAGPAQAEPTRAPTPETAGPSGAATPAPARLAILAGLGLRETWLRNDREYPETETRTHGALAATLAYRVSEHLAIGVHASAARTTAQHEFIGNTTSERASSSALGVDLAIAVQYEEGPFAIAPWLGRHVSRLHEDVETCGGPRTGVICTSSSATDWTSDFTSWGLTASVLPYRRAPVAVFLVLQTGTGGARLTPGGPGYEYAAASNARAAPRAAAEPPRIGTLVGLGARAAWGPGPYLIPYHPDEPGPRPALLAAVTAAISPHLALGARAAATTVTYRDSVRDCYSLLSADLAISLGYVRPRFTLASWIGRHVTRSRSVDPNYDCEGRDPVSAHWTDDFTSYGVTATLDVARRGAHELAVFVDAQTGTGGGHLRSSDTGSFLYSAVTVGLAYRR